MPALNHPRPDAINTLGGQDLCIPSAWHRHLTEWVHRGHINWSLSSHTHTCTHTHAHVHVSSYPHSLTHVQEAALHLPPLSKGAQFHAKYSALIQVVLSGKVVTLSGN